MTVGIFTHSNCLKHEMGPYHPECPQRLSAIIKTLREQSWSNQLAWKEAPCATKEHLLSVHEPQYVESLFSKQPKDYVSLDADTVMNPYSLIAALRASGALIAAVDDVFTGKLRSAFCAVRPPGHHAEPGRAMGFCLFNNVAIGVSHALKEYGCQRVAIIDFDVHHGNGTQTMFEHESRVCFWSSFQHPFYPGATIPSLHRSIHLCPLHAGTDSAAYRQKVDTELVPLLEKVKPDCIFISAGFDAHFADPLANLNFSTQDYGYITQVLRQIADKYAKGRVISTLEGGYNLSALSESVAEHVRALIA